MTNIVKRLHAYLASELDTSDDAARERDAMIAEAADEIERLRAVLESLTKELPATLDEPDTDGEVIIKMRAIARAALNIHALGGGP